METKMLWLLLSVLISLLGIGDAGAKGILFESNWGAAIGKSGNAVMNGGNGITVGSLPRHRADSRVDAVV